MEMVIKVGKDSGGKYWAGRSFESLGSDVTLPGHVFTLKQNEGESIPDFEARVRQEARRRGIKHVERLD